MRASKRVCGVGGVGGNVGGGDVGGGDACVRAYAARACVCVFKVLSLFLSLSPSLLFLITALGFLCAYRVKQPALLVDTS